MNQLELCGTCLRVDGTTQVDPECPIHNPEFPSVRALPRQAKWHIGRAWSGTEIEQACPCIKAACGLAVAGSLHCPEHAFAAAKSIRQSHPATTCPALTGETEIP